MTKHEAEALEILRQIVDRTKRIPAPGRDTGSAGVTISIETVPPLLVSRARAILGKIDAERAEPAAA